MTPVEAAKEKVGKLFYALSALPDARWCELVRGGFEAYTSLPSGIARAYVSTSGYYEVSFVKGDKTLGTLISGSFEEPEMAQSGPERVVRDYNENERSERTYDSPSPKRDV